MAITLDFSVTWSFRDHSNLLIDAQEAFIINVEKHCVLMSCCLVWIIL